MSAEKLRAQGQDADPREQAAQVRQFLMRCRNDFLFFCRAMVWIEDKETHRAIRFEPYGCQVRVGTMLLSGEWLWILKARRLGITWLLCAYTVWLMTFHPNRNIYALNQDKDYAEDFVERVRFIATRLPIECHHHIGIDSKDCIQFTSSGGQCDAVAATGRALHSTAADLVFVDEASKCERGRKGIIQKLLQAAQPAVETSSTGQIVVLGTSDGPQGDFFQGWNDAAAGKKRYKPVFLHWREHPKRDDAWYKREAADNSSDPLYMKTQYPNTPEEAFEAPTGRVYSMFTRSDKFIRRIPVHRDWKRYRGIDFGGVDPFVCLWGAIIPGDPAGFTIDPSCTNTINELLAYSWDDNGEPKDDNNHACDALRYMVITPGSTGLNGHLHIYRELYVPRSAALNLSVPDLARKVIEMSTVQNSAAAPGGIHFFQEAERVELTVCDRSRADSIVLLAQMGIKPVTGQKQMTGGRGGEIVQGIVRVNHLVCGTASGGAAAAIPKTVGPRLPEDMKRRGIF